MLALLIAIGAVPSASVEIIPPVGTVDVPADRTAILPRIATGGSAAAGLPNGAPIWAQALDPSEGLSYAMDWSALLDGEEKIATIARLTVSASGAALGVQIDTASGRLPTLDPSGEKIGLWLLVDPAFQTNAAFLGAGVLVGIAALIETDASPAKRRERTAIVTVRQQ